MLFDIQEIAVIKRQRTAMDPKKLMELAEDIKGLGRLIHPIVVRHPRPEDHDDEGKPIKEPYVLVAGGRRLAAHVLLEKKQIEGRLFDNLSPLDQEIVELSENLYREDISWQDAVKAKERIHFLRTKQNPFQSMQDTADELGEHKTSVSRDLHLAHALTINPALASAPSKRAAQRQIDHQIQIASRILNIADTDVEDLKGKLFTADGRDFVRALASKSVDLHFTDLPYGIGYKSASKTGGGSHVLGEYDDSPEKIRNFVTDIVPEMARTIKPTGWIVCFFASDGMEWLRGLFRNSCSTHGAYRIDSEDPEQNLRCYATLGQHTEECRFLVPENLDWIWYRPNSRNISQWPERHAKHVYESILVVNGGDARLTELHVPDLLVFDSVYENRLHEMQKPHDLCKEIIRRTTIPGELVVDLCFGSGAHVAAAADMGRDFKACELNPELLPTGLAHVAGFYKPAGMKAAQAGTIAAENTRRELRLMADT